MLEQAASSRKRPRCCSVTCSIGSARGSGGGADNDINSDNNSEDQDEDEELRGAGGIADVRARRVRDETRALLLSPLNDAVDNMDGSAVQLPESLWTEWLWGADPMEEYHMDVLMNRMHLLGLLVARYRAAKQTRFRESGATLAQFLQDARLRNLCLFFDTPVRAYSLRQLMDTLLNLQLQWNRYNLCRIAEMQEAVDVLFHRFGVLASRAGSAASEYNEPESVEPADDDAQQNKAGASKVQLNRICMRRMVGSFLVLQLHMHCWQAREEIDGGDMQVVDCDIKLHHVLAASDDFSKLSMHWDLMPSAKLNYVHDFRGLFNCVSQVVYFHNPQYERRMQERKRIEDVSKGQGGVEMVQLLGPIMQLHPEISVEHEDTSHMMMGEKKDKWMWLVMGRTVYLCSPFLEDGDEEEGRTLYYHPNVAVLLGMYRKRIGT